MVLAKASERIFCNLKSKFPFILKKYQQFNAKGRPFDQHNFPPDHLTSTGGAVCKGATPLAEQHEG
jgi:hypothetical protein